MFTLCLFVTLCGEVVLQNLFSFVQVDEMEQKLEKLRSGVVLVKPEDRKIIEETCNEKVNQWRKRKRIFKELWDAITENSPKDLKEFKVPTVYHPFLMYSLGSIYLVCLAVEKHLFFQEELGLDYDEDVGVNLQSYAELINRNKKRKTGA